MKSFFQQPFLSIKLSLVKIMLNLFADYQRRRWLRRKGQREVEQKVMQGLTID